MAPKPLEILKKGLNNFSKKIKVWKDTLTLKLSCKESISSADEQWLDHKANTVEEEHVLLDLEKASDLSRLMRTSISMAEMTVMVMLILTQLIVMHSRQCQ